MCDSQGEFNSSAISHDELTHYTDKRQRVHKSAVAHIPTLGVIASQDDPWGSSHWTGSPVIPHVNHFLLQLGFVTVSLSGYNKTHFYNECLNRLYSSQFWRRRTSKIQETFQVDSSKRADSWLEIGIYILYPHLVKEGVRSFVSFPSLWCSTIRTPSSPNHLLKIPLPIPSHL